MKIQVKYLSSNSKEILKHVLRKSLPENEVTTRIPRWHFHNNCNNESLNLINLCTLLNKSNKHNRQQCHFDTDHSKVLKKRHKLADTDTNLQTQKKNSSGKGTSLLTNTMYVHRETYSNIYNYNFSNNWIVSTSVYAEICKPKLKYISADQYNCIMTLHQCSCLSKLTAQLSMIRLHSWKGYFLDHIHLCSISR